MYVLKRVHVWDIAFLKNYVNALHKSRRLFTPHWRKSYLLLVIENDSEQIAVFGKKK